MTQNLPLQQAFWRTSDFRTSGPHSPQPPRPAGRGGAQQPNLVAVRRLRNYGRGVAKGVVGEGFAQAVVGSSASLARARLAAARQQPWLGLMANLGRARAKVKAGSVRWVARPRSGPPLARLGCALDYDPMRKAQAPQSPGQHCASDCVFGAKPPNRLLSSPSPGGARGLGGVGAGSWKARKFGNRETRQSQAPPWQHRKTR